MAYFVRKFERAKWDNSLRAFTNNGYNKNYIEGDTFSKCLFTSDNTLSVWYSETSKWEDMNAILAIIFSSCDGPGRSDIIIIDEDDLVDVIVTDESGGAPVTDEYNKLHRNFSKIDYKTMGYVAEKMATIILQDPQREEDDKRVKRFSERDVENIVKDAAMKGIIDIPKACSKKRWASRLQPNNDIV
ncbi:hypothetical protein [Aeromonas enteropelogenes]|uniref:hypothetical protein n=1 Tax=Aeromonas enteropelogenes TaxID=29489 RepID=UPI002285A7BC|nr:hypothetical protein [Aeromonas enteropelogenes]MCZ0750091.1 hypothetical protein [Aeromonas enteropelogenes]